MKTFRTAKTLFMAVSFAIIFATASLAAEISETIFMIEAQAADLTARFSVPLTSGNINGNTLSWTLDHEIPLVSKTGTQLGILRQASVQYIADPVVVLNFLVSTGGAAANFTVTSANLGFTGIPGARGRAQAELTVTDFGGDGASLTGNFPNNDSFRTFYNDIGAVPATGTTFATLTPGISSSPFSGATSSEGYPDSVGGFTTVNELGGSLGTVSSMSSQWKFRVSQNDSASGTSVYVIIPEPSSALIGVLGMGLLGLIRRR